MTLLTEHEITAELVTVPAWTRAGDSIFTVTQRADFRDALLYLGAVAYLAESADHHPDVTIQWNKVTLTLSTHSAGGLTANDFALARQISALPGLRLGESHNDAAGVSPDLNKKTPLSLL